ncbi:MAG: replicative DNA helicase [Bacteroidota bacterium]|nr:replicative DNA helicase [Bacteroidota bacterium]
MAKKTSYKKKNEISVDGEIGKLPPQAVEIEKDVLGAIMLEKGVEINVMDLLTAESFYAPANGKIFQAISDLSIEQKPIDYHTVIEKLKKNDDLEAVGGPGYVVSLTSRVGSGAHIDYHSKIIAEKHIQRQLIVLSSEIQRKAYDESSDVNDLLEFSQQEVFDLALGSVKKSTERIDAVMSKALDELEERYNREDSLSGSPSGFTSLDRITSGWQPSDLVIIAARPSMGKTAFVLSMARNMAVEHKQNVAFFSLEMSSIQLVNRLISSETELDGNKIRSGKLSDKEWEQLDTNLSRLSEAAIFIDDTPAITLFELRSKCRKLTAQHDLDLIVIDYLQLMTGPPETKGNREQEVSTISRGLKAVAKELNIPIIALSQLNRSVEMRSGEKRPQLSDLRESGAIEQDADIVMFIHRPEKMGMLEDHEGNSTKGLAELIIAKHRNGPVTDVQLRFVEQFARFQDSDSSELMPMDGDGSEFTIQSKMNDDDDDDFDPSHGFPGGMEDAPF